MQLGNRIICVDFLDVNSVSILMRFLCLSSDFLSNTVIYGVGLVSNYKEGGGESSITDVVICRCLMGCNFDICFSKVLSG